MPITWSNTNHTWNLSGGNVSYVLHVNAARQLMGVYWGKRVHDQAITFVPEDYPGFASFDLPVGCRTRSRRSVPVGMAHRPLMWLIRRVIMLSPCK